MKKTLLLIIIASLVSSSVFFAPPAEAQTQKMVNTITKRYGIYIGVAAALGTTAAICAAIPSPAGSSPGPLLRSTGDFCTTFQKAGENLGNAAKDFFEKIAEYLAKYAVGVIKQRILGMLTDQIINWIQGGGNPKFVTNWQGFAEDVANQAVGDVIQRTIPQLCSPFSVQANIALKILLPGGGHTPLSPSSCTLDKVIQNIQAFYDDFGAGGFVAYQASWQPQNNFYGSLLLTMDAASHAAGAAAEASTNEAQSSGGFLSQKQCDVEITNGADHETVANQSDQQIQNLRQNLEVGATLAVRNCRIVTPGSFVGAALSKAVGSKVDAIIQADDISIYIDAIANAAINRLTQEGSEGLLKLTTKENPSGTYPTQGDFDDVINNYTIPPQEVLVQGGQCTTEDDTTTSGVDEGGQEGIYVTPPSGSGTIEELFCQSIATTGGANQLSAQNAAYRREMVEVYKNMLDNQRKILLLKKKTLHHMNSVVFFAQTVFPQIESCPANDDWVENKWGTDINILSLGRVYSEADSESSEISKIEGEITKTEAIITSINNRLNQLQAPHDKFTGQVLGISASQVGNYYLGLTNIISQHGTQAPSTGTQLLNGLVNAQNAALSQLVGLGVGSTNTNIPNINITQGPEGYVAILLNDTFTLNREGGTVIVDPISPIFVDQDDPLFTPASTYSQFFSNTTLTNEVVEALWTSYQNFKLENWLTSESVTLGSSFFNKNIKDAIHLAYNPYFDLFSRDLYQHSSPSTSPDTGWSVTSSPDPEIAAIALTSTRGITSLGGGGLIGYELAGIDDENDFVPPGYGLYTNCTGQAVFNQEGY